MHENKNPDSKSLLQAGRWFRLRYYAHRYIPWLFDNPFLEYSLEFHRKDDPEENKKTCPEENELIELHCLWAVELYTPMHAEDLASAFINLGWNAEDTFGFRENPVTRLQSSRALSSGGGWCNLGTLIPPDSKKLWVTPYRRIKLPEHVEYATAHLIDLTSSISCVVIGFVFDEKYRLIYDSALREVYRTEARRLKRGIGYISPELHKRDKIIRLRQEIRKQAKDWFATNMPGTFCNLEKNNMTYFPTCEFVTLKGIEPFPEGGLANEHQSSILGLLNMNLDWNTWISERISGLKFSWPVISLNKKYSHAALAISRENLDKVDMEIYGGHSTSGYMALLDRISTELLSWWACLSLISVHEERLYKIRDSKNYKSSNKNTLSLLARIRGIVSESIDISMFCPELIEFSQRGLKFRYGDTFNLSGTTRLPKGERMFLVDTLSNEIVEGSRRLLRLDRSLKEQIIQQGNLLSASENIKLQKWIGALTFVITVLTLVLVYDSLKDINFLDNWIMIKGILWSFIHSWIG